MYFDDPEHDKEEWDSEKFLANNFRDACRRCKKMAECYTQEGKLNVELIEVKAASKRTKKVFYCRFRS